MYTVDASTWVNSLSIAEHGYAGSAEFFQQLRRKAFAVVVPNLLLAEVAGAISRTRADPDLALSLARSIALLPLVKLIPMDSALANLACDLAATYQLRGADAVYAAVALQEKCALVSRDKDHLKRLTKLIKVLTPEQALADL